MAVQRTANLVADTKQETGYRLPAFRHSEAGAAQCHVRCASVVGVSFYANREDKPEQVLPRRVFGQRVTRGAGQPSSSLLGALFVSHEIMS